jgi:5-formyltetrahydrofolate cyclo-ligase
MSSNAAFEKREIRQKLRALVKTISVGEIKSASERACALLCQQPIWKNARSVLFYSAMGLEIDLSAVLEEGLRAGKEIALPGFVKERGVYDAFRVGHRTNDCVPGKLGILEPAPHCVRFPLNRLDLALVAGVGFDSTGCRLGRGQGYYDRLLAGVSGIKCGVAFDQQVVERIPWEPHDVRMNCILTPTRWLTFSE